MIIFHKNIVINKKIAKLFLKIMFIINNVLKIIMNKKIKIINMKIIYYFKNIKRVAKQILFNF